MWRLVNLLANGDDVNIGEGMSGFEGSEVNEALQKVVDLVHGPVLDVIMIVLGLFLVVKGAILGVQIVKAADEPQVRQEKIGSLKWLIIGIAVAYGITFAAKAILSTFKNNF